MLTDARARKAKGSDKDYKLADAGGLYLYVTTKGFRSWRLKYRVAGREKRLVFGPYPDVSLASAPAAANALAQAAPIPESPLVTSATRPVSVLANIVGDV